MNRKVIILINIVTIIVVMLFVIAHAFTVWQGNLAMQTTSFDKITVAIENMMSAFLVEEQRICNNWSHYVDAKHMDIDEAIDYVRLVKPSEGTAHIVYLDDGSYSGKSTATAPGRPNLNSVSYAHIDILSTLGQEEPTDNSVNLTRVFTNPIDGIPSVAFCHPVTLRDDETGAERKAVLMRVVPASVADLDWVFRAEQVGAEVALTDENGAYIFKGDSFTGDSFEEYLKGASVHDGNADETLDAFRGQQSGHVTLTSADGRTLLISFSPLHSAENRMILASIPVEVPNQRFDGNSLIVVVAVGLLLIATVGLATQRSWLKRMRSLEDEADKAESVTNDFISAMSHDFRTPLNTLIGVTALASSKLDDPEIVSDCLRKIGLHANYLNTMLNDVLDVFQIESGEFRLSPAPFSIVDSASTLVNMSQAMIREKNIDFSFHIDQLECENFYADQVRINQVMINLLSSALKFSPQGGRVHVSLHERLGKTPDTTTLIYSVSDTGNGITEKELASISHPFAVNERDENAPDGVVLGLALTQRIVERLGGTLSFNSTPGKGTTASITLELPRADQCALRDIALPSVHVLVVDENADLRQTSKETLQSLGAVVSVAASGREGIDLINAERAEGEDFDVVILGRRMQDMDGLHTAALMHKELAEPLPKLLISAYDWTDLRQDAREAGVDGFVSKPLFRSTLYKKICEVLGIEIAAAPEEDYSDLAGMHILVADDNDINWTLVSNMLQTCSITCERAENGQKALDRMATAREGEISMVFMDLHMPGMDGLEAARAIRSLSGSNAAVPIVAMTSEATVQDVEACMAAGMDGHMAKPIDMAHMMQEIRKAREAKRTQGAVRKGE